MIKAGRLSELDRLAIRERPNGQPLMHQTWGKLLFMHWRIEVSELRPLIPQSLEIDTFDGTAWIGIIPFTMWDIRALPPFVPAVPGFSSAHELNVRTYVHYDGVPGVWFFSLDCNSSAAVIAARTFYHLPYYNASIDLEQSRNTIDYALARTDKPDAFFQGSWNIGDTVPFSHPHSLEFFLTERYCLYSQRDGDFYRARIFHQPWPLQKATINSYESTMIEALGLKSRADNPVLNYAESLDVDIWAIKKL
ncbi:MAG: YqjF family protein [Pyrinomonadaceae bacterium]